MYNTCDLSKALRTHIHEINCMRWTPEQMKLNEERVGNEKTKLKNEKYCCKTSDVVQLLSILAKTCQAKRIVELDCQLGCLTLGLALGLPKDGKICAWDYCEETIKGLKLRTNETEVENKVHNLKKSNLIWLKVYPKKPTFK